MLVKQQKCDTVSHKQHQAAKLAQNKSVLTHSQTPMPQQYADFDDEKIQSFSINLGFQIDVIYIESLGVWSFRIVEPDMGANIGTPKERKAVSGRTCGGACLYDRADVFKPCYLKAHLHFY
jgi:hypothetical protein